MSTHFLDHRKPLNIRFFVLFFLLLTRHFQFRQDLKKIGCKLDSWENDSVWKRSESVFFLSSDRSSPHFVCEKLPKNYNCSSFWYLRNRGNLYVFFLFVVVIDFIGAHIKTRSPYYNPDSWELFLVLHIIRILRRLREYQHERTLMLPRLLSLDACVGRD